MYCRTPHWTNADRCKSGCHRCWSYVLEQMNTIFYRSLTDLIYVHDEKDCATGGPASAAFPAATQLSRGFAMKRNLGYVAPPSHSSLSRVPLQLPSPVHTYRRRSATCVPFLFSQEAVCLVQYRRLVFYGLQYKFVSVRVEFDSCLLNY